MTLYARTDKPINKWLTPGKAYVLVGVCADDFRVLNDLGEPSLFAPGDFEPVSIVIPPDWSRCVGDDGEQYADPLELHQSGFYERYFDREPEAVLVFKKYASAHGLSTEPDPARNDLPKGFRPI